MCSSCRWVTPTHTFDNINPRKSRKDDAHEYRPSSDFKEISHSAVCFVCYHTYVDRPDALSTTSSAGNHSSSAPYARKSAKIQNPGPSSVWAGDKPTQRRAVMDIEERKQAIKAVGEIDQGGRNSQFKGVEQCTALKKGTVHKREVVADGSFTASYVEKIEKREEVFASEASIMELLVDKPHPNIIELFKGKTGVVRSENTLRIAYGGVDLKTVLLAKARGNETHQDATVLDLQQQFLSGVKHLYRCFVVHLDHKGANIFLMPKAGEQLYQLKIGDFGAAIQLLPEVTEVSSKRVAGTWPLLAELFYAKICVAPQPNHVDRETLLHQDAFLVTMMLKQEGMTNPCSKTCFRDNVSRVQFISTLCLLFL